MIDALFLFSHMTSNESHNNKKREGDWQRESEREKERGWYIANGIGCLFSLFIYFLWPSHWTVDSVCDTNYLQIKLLMQRINLVYFFFLLLLSLFFFTSFNTMGNHPSKSKSYKNNHPTVQHPPKKSFEPQPRHSTQPQENTFHVDSCIKRLIQVGSSNKHIGKSVCLSPNEISTICRTSYDLFMNQPVSKLSTLLMRTHFMIIDITLSQSWCESGWRRT